MIIKYGFENKIKREHKNISSSAGVKIKITVSIVLDSRSKKIKHIIVKDGNNILGLNKLKDN